MKRRTFRSHNKTTKEHIDLPMNVYPKIFGYTFIVTILFVGLSICILLGADYKTNIKYAYYNINEPSALTYLIITSIIFMVSAYEIINWILIISKRKYIKITNKQIIFRNLFYTKKLNLENIKYVDFSFTDLIVYRPKTEGMLIKCDDNTSKINSTDLYVNYYEFPEEDLVKVISSVLKFESKK